MKNLPKHIEKIGFAVVFLLCSGLLYMQIEMGAGASGSDLNTSIAKVEDALSRGKVTPGYAFSDQAAEKNLKYKELFALSDARMEKITLEAVPAYVAYMRPSRPKVDQGGKPTGIQTKTEVAVLGQLSDLGARGDHGAVFITFKVPTANVHIVNSHVEVFRGEAADKIDTSKPHAIVDLTPIEIDEEKPKDDKPKVEPGPRERERGEPKKEEKKDDKKDAADAAELANVQVYGDTQVEAKKTYFYKLRLVGKMTVQPNVPQEQKDASGVVTHMRVVAPPEGLQTGVALEGASGSFYQGALTEAISAAPPANYEFWLSGIIGEVSQPGTPLPQIKHDYQGRFAVKVWVPAATQWVETTVSVGEGQKIAGEIRYKNAKNELVKEDFDTGYKMIEIVWGDRPVSTKGTVKTVPSEKAVVEETATKKREDYWKGGDAEKRGRDLKALRDKWEAERKAKEKAKNKKKDPKKPK